MNSTPLNDPKIEISENPEEEDEESESSEEIVESVPEECGGICMRTELNGRWLVVVFCVVLFLTTGGNFGEMWLRNVYFNGTMSCEYNNATTVNATLCPLDYLDSIFIISYAVSFIGMGAAAIVFYYFGAKYTGCAGVFIKVIGCILMAAHCNDAMFGAGYVLYIMGPAVILISTFHVVALYDTFAKQTTLITLLVAIYFAGGAWISFVLYRLMLVFPLEHVYYGYAAILVVIFFVPLFVWPHDTTHVVLPEEQTSSSLRSQILNWNFFFRMSFLSDFYI